MPLEWRPPVSDRSPSAPSASGSSRSCSEVLRRPVQPVTGQVEEELRLLGGQQVAGTVEDGEGSAGVAVEEGSACLHTMSSTGSVRTTKGSRNGLSAPSAVMKAGSSRSTTRAICSSAAPVPPGESSAREPGTVGMTDQEWRLDGHEIDGVVDELEHLAVQVDDRSTVAEVLAVGLCTSHAAGHRSS